MCYPIDNLLLQHTEYQIVITIADNRFGITFNTKVGYYCS